MHWQLFPHCLIILSLAIFCHKAAIYIPICIFPYPTRCLILKGQICPGLKGLDILKLCLHDYRGSESYSSSLISSRLFLPQIDIRLDIWNPGFLKKKYKTSGLKGKKSKQKILIVPTGHVCVACIFLKSWMWKQQHRCVINIAFLCWH